MGEIMDIRKTKSYGSHAILIFMLSKSFNDRMKHKRPVVVQINPATAEILYISDP